MSRASRTKRDLIGVALAGGQSRRMGREKASMPLPDHLGGGNMVSWAAERLSALDCEVVIADRGQGLVPGYASIEDGPGSGPAAGILGAAKARPGKHLLILACDLPLVPISFLRQLVSYREQWVVPISKEQRLEPLCALYAPATLTRLESRVERGLFSLQGLAQAAGQQVRRLAPEQWHKEMNDDSIFLNVNRPEDFAALAAARQNRLRQGSTSQ